MHEDALTHFAKSVALDPSYALAHKNLGNSYLVQGDYANAEVSFRTAIAINESMIEAIKGLATALIQQGKIADGKAVRLKAKELIDRRRDQ